MISARVLSRSAPRAVRSARQLRSNGIRFQSTTTQAAGTGSSHVAAGAAGGLVGVAVLYLAYSMTPTGQMASKINKASKEVSKTYQQAAKQLQETTPDADQAVEYIKQLCYSYVGWVPGGKTYVDAAFKDYYTVREKHRDEINQIVGDAYKQFQNASKSGLSLETATKAYEILADVSHKIAGLAGDAIEDILDNHPQLKSQVGPSVDQLKQMGEHYGPEAKKQVDETWNKAKGILAGGFSLATADKLRKLFEETVEQVKKLGDEAWKKGLETAKPYLDKNPKVMQIIEENADALKQGNITGLFEQAKKAIDSGSIDDFEKYVKDTASKATSKASGKTSGLLGALSGGLGLEQLMDKVPQGKEILPKLHQLADVATSRGEEGQQLLKETVNEIKRLLEDKGEKAQKILDKAKKDAK